MPQSSPPTGEFRETFTLTELLGTKSAARYQDTVRPDEPIEWQVFVPESNNPERPAGILLYISPGNSGRIPNQWKSLMDDHNLIWIGANKSGNRVLLRRRMVFALMAPAAIDRNYAIDADRIYLSGFSGGGRAASIVAAHYPQIFKGGIFLCGADYWDQETPEGIEQIRDNRYVFVTGTYDHNLEPTKKAYRGFQNAGVSNSELMVIRDMGHSMPKRRDFEKAIAFLDSPIS